MCDLVTTHVCDEPLWCKFGRDRTCNCQKQTAEGGYKSVGTQTCRFLVVAICNPVNLERLSTRPRGDCARARRRGGARGAAAGRLRLARDGQSMSTAAGGRHAQGLSQRLSQRRRARRRRHSPAPLPASVGANPIIDDYSLCHVCSKPTTRVCQHCDSFLQRRVRACSRARGHAAACNYILLDRALCAADNNSQFRSGDNRPGAIMLHCNTGENRGGIPCDIYHALLSSCTYRKIIPKQSSIGLVIVDTPPHKQAFANNGTIVGRIGVLASPRRQSRCAFPCGAELDEVDDLSKKMAYRKARTARATVLLEHLKMLAAEMMAHARKPSDADSEGCGWTVRSTRTSSARRCRQRHRSHRGSRRVCAEERLDAKSTQSSAGPAAVSSSPTRPSSTTEPQPTSRTRRGRRMPDAEFLRARSRCSASARCPWKRARQRYAARHRATAAAQPAPWLHAGGHEQRHQRDLGNHAAAELARTPARRALAGCGSRGAVQECKHAARLPWRRPSRCGASRRARSSRPSA